MELYLCFFMVMCCANYHVISQNIVCDSSDIRKPHILNGHYVKWPSKQVEADYLRDKSFIPENIIFTRFQICGNHVFLVSPRYKVGVPFSLSHVTLGGEDKFYNYVQPYPSIEKSVANDSESIINAVDICMGQNGILWVLDTGIVPREKSRKIFGAKVLGIDYGNGRIVHMIPLTSFTHKKYSRLQYILVEYINNDSPIIYIGDGGTRSIIVLNVQANELYSVKLPRYISAHSRILTVENMFHVVLIESTNSSYLYFTYQSNKDMFKVHTRDLHKRINPIIDKYIINVGQKPCEMVVLGSAYGTVIYFRIRGSKNLYSWDTKKNISKENIMLVKKSRDCRSITHIDVDNNGVLWELESNFHDYAMNSVGRLGASVIIAPIFDEPVTMAPLKWKCLE